MRTDRLKKGYAVFNGKARELQEFEAYMLSDSAQWDDSKFSHCHRGSMTLLAIAHTEEEAIELADKYIRCEIGMHKMFFNGNYHRTLRTLSN